jgi:predicted DNA-binding transcriptional regulator YafY
MATSTRLLHLLSLLQEKRFWTGAELATRLSVTQRTLRRDADRLRRLGYPVHAAAGIGGGYQLGAGKELPPLPLDDDEAVAVAVGLRSVAAGAVSGLEEVSVRALAKLERVLPARLRRRFNALFAFTVSVPEGGARVAPDVLSLLAAACRDANRLRFGYADRKRTASKRIVEPLRLVNMGRRWYLLAYDLDRDDWRTFRVDRFAGRPSLGPRFPLREPPAADLVAYMTRSLAGEPHRFRARVTLHAPLEEVAARIGAGTGVLERIDARRCLLHTSSDSLWQLSLYIGLLGTDFEVHDPPELIESVRVLAERCTRACAVEPTSGPRRSQRLPSGRPGIRVRRANRSR